jgi:hypothetical protein
MKNKQRGDKTKKQHGRKKGTFLFNDAFSVTRLYSVDERMDLVGSGRGLILRYYPGIRLDELKRN